MNIITQTTNPAGTMIMLDNMIWKNQTIFNSLPLTPWTNA